MVFRTARGRAAPVRRVEMNARSRRVSSTHAWNGSCARRSEISSSVKVGLWVGTTRLVVVGVAAAVLTLTAAFFLDFPEARVEAAEDLTSGFFRLGRFSGGGHYRLLGHFHD